MSACLSLSLSVIVCLSFISVFLLLSINSSFFLLQITKVTRKWTNSWTKLVTTSAFDSSRTFWPGPMPLDATTWEKPQIKFWEASKCSSASLHPSVILLWQSITIYRWKYRSITQFCLLHISDILDLVWPILKWFLIFDTPCSQLVSGWRRILFIIRVQPVNRLRRAPRWTQPA